MLAIPNLNLIRTESTYTAEALTQIVTFVNSMCLQLGIDGSGTLPPPPNIGSISVVAANGFFDIAITDKSPVSRAINYFVEYSTTAQFQQPIPIYLGPVRNLRVFLDSSTYYFRAYSMYQGSSSASNPITFGNPPTGVAGGGVVAGPPAQPSQGSGTASGQQGGQGFGTDQTQQS